jgi:hypothetical protein
VRLRLRDGTDVDAQKLVLGIIPLLLAVLLPPVGLVACAVLLRRERDWRRPVLLAGLVIGGLLTLLAVLGILAAGLLKG